MTESDLTGFANFYKAYPKKRAIQDAKKAWVQTKKDRPPTEEIVLAVIAQSKSKEWKKDGGQYVPYPATWLRAGQWADVIDYDVKLKVQCMCGSNQIIGQWMNKPYCSPECKKQIRGY